MLGFKKPVPVNVTGRFAAPACAELGAIVVSVGAGGGLTVKLTPFDVPLVLVTVIEVTPADAREPLGIVAVKLVELTNVVTSEVTPKNAVLGFIKLVPVRFMSVFPAPAVAVWGAIDVSVGVGGGGGLAVIVNVSPLEVPEAL